MEFQSDFCHVEYKTLNSIHMNFIKGLKVLFLVNKRKSKHKFFSEQCSSVSYDDSKSITYGHHGKN
jgi:hypothetical protein